MMRYFSTTRWPILQLVLALCMPLCCCRVAEIVAMTSGQEPGPAEVESGGGDHHHHCCGGCQSSGDEDSPSKGSGGGDESPGHACDGGCCLKGTTSNSDHAGQLTVAFAFVLASPEIVAAESASGRSVDADPVRRGPPCDSLVRRRCALLI